MGVNCPTIFRRRATYSFTSSANFASTWGSMSTSGWGARWTFFLPLQVAPRDAIPRARQPRTAARRDIFMVFSWAPRTRATSIKPISRACRQGGGGGCYTPRPLPPAARDDRLFTPRFFVMCGFTFTVFLSALQLLPTMPFRILALGGSKFAAGLFLGFLTYASALSAPLTGALADRLGKRRMLIVCSLVIAGFSVAYALSRSYRVPLALAFAHGIFWSGLLSASAAYITDIVPESRRAEGIGYWGLSTIVAIAVAPTIGFWVYGHGW